MILKYKIHCNTENTDKYWLLQNTDPSPSKCPTNSAHSVDLSSVVVVDSGDSPKEVITQYEKNDKDLKLAKVKAVVDNSGTAITSLKIPGTFGSGDGRYVAGGYGIAEDYNPDDYVTVRIEDSDRVLALLLARQLNPSATAPLSDQQVQEMGNIPNIGEFPQYPILRSYTDDDFSEVNQGWYFWPLAQGNNLPPVGEVEIEPIGGYGFLPSGLYIILTYHRPDGITSGTLRANFWWGKKE